MLKEELCHRWGGGGGGGGGGGDGGGGVKTGVCRGAPQLHCSNHTVSVSFLVLNVDRNLIWFIRDGPTLRSSIYSACTPRAH